MSLCRIYSQNFFLYNIYNLTFILLIREKCCFGGLTLILYIQQKENYKQEETGTWVSAKFEEYLQQIFG